MEKKNKKSVVIGITILLLVTLILLGLTYAYYRTRIVGNEEEKSISVTSKKLEVTYSDDKAVIEASDIEPGYTATKTFSVTNTGSEPTNFGIVLDNVENTFTRKSDWTFVLKQGDTVIREGIVPSSKTYIANTISIASDETIEYTLTINYANLTTEDQSEDMGNILSLRVNIDNETGAILESATEGTLLAAIRDDNLISEPLSVPGKSKSGIKYNEGSLDSSSAPTNVNFANYSESYIVYGTGYEFDKASGTYYLTGVSTCLVGECLADVVGNYVANTSTNNLLFTSEADAKLQKTDGLSSVYLASRLATETRISFQKVNMRTTESINEAVLSSTEDDYGTSYYFRGDVKNNYVTFSGMCWRVVRVQGDGSIKLALADGDYPCSENIARNEDGSYSGYTTEHPGSAYILDSRSLYNSNVLGNQNDVLYENSDIKPKLDAWISETKEDGSSVIDTSKLVNNAKWCQDTAVTSKDNNDLNYGSYDRLLYYESANPTLKCTTASIDGSITNVIESNVGMLSADELVFAGYILYDTSNNYLVTNAKHGYWTMTPAQYYSEDGDVTVLYVRNSELEDVYMNEIGTFIRPSIVLKKDVTITSGNGTQGNAYVIS